MYTHRHTEKPVSVTDGIRAHLLGSMREHRRRLQALSKRPKVMHRYLSCTITYIHLYISDKQAADETSRPKALIERNDLQDLLDEEEEHQEGQDRSTGNNEDVPSTLQPRKKKRTACDTVDVYMDLHHDEYSTSLRIQRHPSQLSTCAHTSEERTRSIQRTNAQNGLAGELYMAPAEFEDALDRNLPFGISKGCSRPLQATDKLLSNRNP